MVEKKAYLAPELVTVAFEQMDIVTASVASVPFNSDAWNSDWDGWTWED